MVLVSWPSRDHFGQSDAVSDLGMYCRQRPDFLSIQSNGRNQGSGDEYRGIWLFLFCSGRLFVLVLNTRGAR